MKQGADFCYTPQTSFSLDLHRLAWVPAKCPATTLDPHTQVITTDDTDDLHVASDLYERSPLIMGYLTHTVKYLAVTPRRDSLFTRFLKVES